MKIREQRILLKIKLTEQQEDLNFNSIVKCLEDLDFWNLDLENKGVFE